MGCYSHFSDDEREQIGLAEALGHSIGAIAQAIGRPKSTVLRELCRNRLPSGRYSPLHAAGAYQLRRRRAARIIEIEPYGPSLSTGSQKGRPRSKFQAGSRAETNLACGPWVARRSTPSSTGRCNRPSSYGVTSRAITNAAARADRDLRKIPSRVASPSTNGPSMSRPEPRAATGRVTSSFVSVHGQCSFSMSANRA